MSNANNVHMDSVEGVCVHVCVHCYIPSIENQDFFLLSKMALYIANKCATSLLSVSGFSGLKFCYTVSLI